MKRILSHVYVENCKEALDFYQGIFGGEIKNTQSSDGMEMFKATKGS